MTISYSAGINASNLIAIRGVSGLPSPIGTSQATAVYLDGVYLSRPNAAFFSLDDVERVEVLRGPQGTLYGRNATAGAINIITRLPGDTLRGGANVSYGNFNTVQARGSISGPLAEGFSAGLSGSYDEHDGYFENTVTGNDFGDRKSYTVRGTTRYVNSDESLSAVVSADYSKSDRQDAFRNVYAGPVYVGIGDPDKIAIDAVSEGLAGSYTKSGGVALTINYSVNDSVDLVSVTSYREVEASDNYDLDGTPAPAIFTRSFNTSDTFNQELRAVYSTDRLHVTAGANYFTEDATYALAPFGPPRATYALTAPANTSDLAAYAIFGQIEYDVTPTVTLVGGLRYNSEQRDFVVDYTGAPIPGRRTTGRIDDDVVIPSGGVNWQLSPDVLVYGKVSRGYQAPGFNAQPGAAATVPNTFDAEEMTAYEMGIKSQFVDRRVTLNAAGFWYDYSDLQVRNTIGLGLTSISNAGAATVEGVELTLSGLVTDSLTLSGQVTYLNAEYDDFCEAISGGTPLNGDPLCSTPTYADRVGKPLEFGARVVRRRKPRLPHAGRRCWGVVLQLGLCVGRHFLLHRCERSHRQHGRLGTDGRACRLCVERRPGGLSLRQEPDRRTIRRPRAPWTADARAKSRQRSSYLRAGSSLSVLTHYRTNRPPCAWARGVIRMQVLPLTGWAFAA
ncbi:MAG: TonB-dependent receptor [Proteobacteria bacterium]|nr:TonB-dependent receptor [Pseudomonadota bacterium]